MIARNAEPIGHISPYPRIDLSPIRRANAKSRDLSAMEQSKRSAEVERIWRLVVQAAEGNWQKRQRLRHAVGLFARADIRSVLGDAKWARIRHSAPKSFDKPARAAALPRRKYERSSSFVIGVALVLATNSGRGPELSQREAKEHEILVTHGRDRIAGRRIRCIRV
jgi:hypothetical protein